MQAQKQVLYLRHEKTPKLAHTIWKVFFNNGQVYEHMPDKGFANFSMTTNLDFMNNYVYSSPGLWLIKRPGVVEIKLESKKTDNIEIGIQSYYRCKSVDGLKLQGSWTSLSDPNSPDMNNYQSGQKPLISFTKEGTFTDEGIFTNVLQIYQDNAPIKTAGSGTYIIKDYSLILFYYDGHIKQVAFTGFLSVDPAVNDDRICIGRAKIRKRTI